MSETTPTVGHYQELFDQAGDVLPGAGVAWVAERRRAALNRFTATGFPAPRAEDWKYTSLKPIEKRPFALPQGNGSEVAAADIAPFTFDEPAAHRLVFVDGVFSPDLSTIGELPAGVTVQPMSAALNEGGAILEHHLGRYADPEGTPFVALNTALMHEGAFIHVPAGTEVTAPVHLLFVSSDSADGVGPHYRNLVVAEADAAVTVIEEFAGLGEAVYFNNVVTEAAADERARITVYKLQEESEAGYHIATFEAYQGNESAVAHHNVSLGGRLVRNDITGVLDAEGAEVTLNGLYLGDGRQHVDNHTRIDHLQPGSVSNEYYKGILDGRSRGVFNGKVVVQPQAQQTESDQQNRNLLLSRNAEVDPKPELEIFADDVTATHGATVGQLDEKALFFLRSRGIDTPEARNLLIFGFANEIIEQIGIAPVRARLEAHLLSRLPHTSAMED
ncbi:MAG TPA: Fe-S cluster assembly protein SufD [Gammaproteobacteria bacterium]|nr:Fe-S cluster assembly protein SufD [Gammaproteobacteria bacterium]